MNNLVESKERVRGALLKFQEAMEANEFSIPGDDPRLPLEHMFSGGVYVRTIRIPKGMFVMGRIHRREHPNILVSGSVIMMTEEGVERISAPKHMLSPAGTKRFLYTLEDTVWSTIHKTDARTPEEAEEDVVCDSYEDIGFEYKELINGGMKWLG